MPEDINELDVNDIGLKMIMGDRFHDETTENPEKAKKGRNGAQTPDYRRMTPPPAAEPGVEHKVTKDAQDQQSNVPEPNWLDRLKACAKVSLLSGGLCLLFFYWQQTGQMQPTAALPCMLTCAALFGLGIGKNTDRGNR